MQRYIKLLVVTSTKYTFFYTFNEIVIATDIKQMMIASDLHGVTRTTSVNIREIPMQKQPTNIIIATEWHGITRTTSVNIRDAPMQKKQTK